MIFEPGASSPCFGFMRLISPRLSDCTGIPALHAREIEQPLGIAGRGVRKSWSVRLYAKGERCEEGISSGEARSDKERATKAGQALYPKLVYALPLGLKLGCEPGYADPQPAVHCADIADLVKARVHLCARAASPSARVRSTWPDGWVALSKVLNDGERVPDKKLAVHEAWNAPGG